MDIRNLASSLLKQLKIFSNVGFWISSVTCAERVEAPAAGGSVFHPITLQKLSYQ